MAEHLAGLRDAKTNWFESEPWRTVGGRESLACSSCRWNVSWAFPKLPPSRGSGRNFGNRWGYSLDGGITDGGSETCYAPDDRAPGSSAKYSEVLRAE